ncbi:YqcC family protein [Vibrio sp. TRT 17S01]|uniref:YqcC family protein n=1 Tax=Vibrio sp. TRT 17S01 TaxID=3418505 RepID=UPI003CF4BFBE
MKKEQQILMLLKQLQVSMMQLDLWQETSPVQGALESTEPFAIDVLAPHEWLQWIFIPKMESILLHREKLPAGFRTSPYFEESWKDETHLESLIVIIRQIEEACA